MDMNLQLVLHAAAYVCFALCAILAFLAFMLYRRDRIRQVMDDLSGKARLHNTAQSDLSSRSLRQLQSMRKREEVALHAEEISADSTPAAVSEGDQAVSSGHQIIAGKHGAQSSSAGGWQNITQRSVANGQGDFLVVKSIVELASDDVVEIK